MLVSNKLPIMLLSQSVLAEGFIKIPQLKRDVADADIVLFFSPISFTLYSWNTKHQTAL